VIRRTALRVRQTAVVVSHCPNAFACWLRVGYPKWAPQSGHVALVALCGQDGSPPEQKGRSSS
jgi:hypothetical protein